MSRRQRLLGAIALLASEALLAEPLAASEPSAENRGDRDGWFFDTNSLSFQGGR